MPHPLTTLGIIHTAISILALLAAFYALFRDGRIDPANGRGKWYIWLTVITCLTAFPIMNKTGHPTAGHYVGIIILILLIPGVYANKIFGNFAPYCQAVIMTTTLLLSLIPALVETFTRLPQHHPLAASPNDPVIQKGMVVLLVLYVILIAYQLIKTRKRFRPVIIT